MHVVLALASAALVRHREVGHAVVSKIEHEKVPDRQFLHHAAGAFPLSVVCCSGMVVTFADVNGETIQLGYGSKGILDALVEERR